MNRWAGPALTALILGGVALIFLLNLEPGASRAGQPSTAGAQPPAVATSTAAAPTAAEGDAGAQPSGTFREYFIGDPIERGGENLEIAAVWFPAVAMDGHPAPDLAHVVHLEADVTATEGNPHGFARGQFVPYLKIQYTITPSAGGEPITGELLPMVARDGLHYGANVALPAAGSYKLSYQFEPPSAGGLGRHADAETGVAAWWPPFGVSWDWDYAPPGNR